MSVFLAFLKDNALPFAAAALVVFLAYLASAHIRNHNQLKVDLAAAADRVEALATRAEQARAASEYVVVYTQRAAEIREVTRTVIKEIPVYVTPEADAACAVPPGFVRVHDAAVLGVPTDHPSVEPDGAAGSPALSAVAATVVHNYGTCNDIRERLIALQGYVKSFEE